MQKITHKIQSPGELAVHNHNIVLAQCDIADKELVLNNYMGRNATEAEVKVQYIVWCADKKYFKGFKSTELVEAISYYNSI